MPRVMGDTDYGPVGAGYTRVRRTDPRIAALIHAALGDARTVVNVGAGAGSYEPAERHVLPVEPSAAMRAQRPAHLAPASHGVAEQLPFDGDELGRLWLMDYVPELQRAESARYPAIATITDALGPNTEVHPVPVPIDCVDGFTEAFYARPESFLDPAVRLAQSAWGFIEPGVAERAMAALAADLASGAWDERYGHLRTEPEFDGAVRLIVSR
ncbi:SAM-dependent methyltransferase [Streptomyces sp. NEAU-YJ-81]|uniref:SAM-dependent methyltransferase n=1 Tax=Streptomyces sp. NEAU-YJ-81 TaxID=2820288 RepID=UPI001ABCFEC0|nr:SAM-dependent methyltransferase [Streptomyces sp. NEAU-YJ-81]MBO3681387.1 SAM-dependent methyltransferase [Streptomyces sp. NEAU-YJ-81]